ncbi:hypothetical protein M1494_02285 [Candidatus Parvarchaeota archaeon]|nr:hypothetical protein [Candidatus Parvarchaeota archaeon]
MKKEAILESLLANAEKIDSYNGYTNDMDFAFSFAVLKINTPANEVNPEYELYKNSNVLTYKRMHFKTAKEDGEDILYLFKNSTPDRVKYVSKGNDSELLSQRLKTNLVYSIDLLDKKRVDPEDNFFKYYKIALIDSPEVTDIDEKREYILENIRKNRDGQTVCWHIYPAFEKGKTFLYILEHNNPNDLRIADLAENDANEDVHYLPVEKDRENWKKYIKR